MSEILAIPELIDVIAESGYENYGFLRCLNKEFHEMWYLMIAYSSDISELDEENDREQLDLYREKTRVLVLNSNVPLSPEKYPNIRYIRLVCNCPQEESLYNFKFLKILDLNWRDFDLYKLPQSCKMINCKTEIYALDKNISELPLSERDKKMFEELKKDYLYDLSLILITTLTTQYLKLVVRYGKDKYLHLYELCDHIEFEIWYDDMSRIVELMEKCRFKNLGISVIDYREQYREEKYCMKYGINCLAKECTLTEDDLETAKKMFDLEKVESLEIVFA